jgi:hypothetical protein
MMPARSPEARDELIGITTTISGVVIPIKVSRSFGTARRDVAFVLLPAYPSGGALVTGRTYRPVALRPVVPLASAARPFPCLLVLGRRSPLIALPLPGASA